MGNPCPQRISSVATRPPFPNDIYDVTRMARNWNGLNSRRFLHLSSAKNPSGPSASGHKTRYLAVEFGIANAPPVVLRYARGQRTRLSQRAHWFGHGR